MLTSHGSLVSMDGLLRNGSGSAGFGLFGWLVCIAASESCLCGLGVAVSAN